MFEYTFARVPVTYQGGRPSPEDYRATVVEHANAGWRLVQVLVLNPAAVPAEYELIFERPRK